MQSETDRPETLTSTPKSDAVVVLLVDDQPIVGEAVRRAVASLEDVTLHFCSQASEALQTAERVKPTVILQDLIMPGGDGLSLVSAYRASELTKDIPIIVLSSMEDATVKSEAFALGANDYLVKLPETMELIARIRYHSRAYMAHAQRDEAYCALRESQQLLLEKNLELERLTNVDVVTGISNRRYFNEFATLHWKQAIRERSAVSILMMDVDDFKRYNDTYGHLAGDEVLKRIGEVLRAECRRPMDLPARFGGEEFIVFIFAPTASAAADGERLCRAVAATAIPHSKSTAAQTVTVSVGGASTVPRQGDSVPALIERADVAMYEAKRLGKNRVVTDEK